MSKQEFAIFVMALKTFYPKETLLPNDQAVDLWFHQLKDIDFKVAEAGLKKWVATNKWSPTIADIRQMALDVTCSDTFDWGEGWAKVVDAISHYGWNRYEEAFASFDEITLQCVKRMGWMNLCCSENVAADRANFRIMYEQIANRIKTDRLMPEKLRERIMLLQKGERNESNQLLTEHSADGCTD